MKIADCAAEMMLKPDAGWQEIIDLCECAIEKDKGMVCVPPCYVGKVKEVFQKKLKICTTAGFPYGYNVTEAKTEEVRQALKDGADEILAILNICDMKNHDYGAVQREMQLLREAACGMILNAVIASYCLEREEQKNFAQIAFDAGADDVLFSVEG